MLLSRRRGEVLRSTHLADPPSDLGATHVANLTARLTGVNRKEEDRRFWLRPADGVPCALTYSPFSLPDRRIKEQGEATEPPQSTCWHVQPRGGSSNLSKQGVEWRSESQRALQGLNTYKRIAGNWSTMVMPTRW